MNRSLEMRLSRAERAPRKPPPPVIPIFCEDEADFAALVESHISAGEIRLEDADRCRPWWLTSGVPWQAPYEHLNHVIHEDILEQLI